MGRICEWGNSKGAKNLSDKSQTTLKRVIIAPPIPAKRVNENLSHPYPQSLVDSLASVPGTKLNYCFFTMDFDFIKYRELPCICSRWQYLIYAMEHVSLVIYVVEMEKVQFEP